MYSYKCFHNIVFLQPFRADIDSIQLLHRDVCELCKVLCNDVVRGTCDSYDLISCECFTRSDHISECFNHILTRVTSRADDSTVGVILVAGFER